MKKILLAGLATGVLMLGLVGTASAFTLDYASSSAGDGSVLTTANSWATVYNFDTMTPANTGNRDVVIGSRSGLYAAPAIGTSSSQKDATRYFSVPKDSGSGSANILFNGSFDYLGLFWGSIDTYNSITFRKGTIDLFTVTGTDVTQPSSANGNQTDQGTNKYVNIYTGAQLFDNIMITSTNYAFELDNLAVGTTPVPVPASMLLLGTGLIGLASALRRKNN